MVKKKRGRPKGSKTKSKVETKKSTKKRKVYTEYNQSIKRKGLKEVGKKHISLVGPDLVINLKR